MTTRTGLFGCGRIATYFHAPILAAHRDVTVTAVVDGAPEGRMRAASILPGATLFAEWQRPMDLGLIDAAVICLPPALHAPVAKAAVERGVHVYIEKPLALTMEEADDLIGVHDRSDVVAMVGLNFRHHPRFQSLKVRLASGEFGELVAVRTLFTSARRDLPGWKRDTSQGGGAVDDLATHHFDLIPFLTDRSIDVSTVTCRTQETGNGSFAIVSAALTDGTPVSVTVGQTTGHGTQKIELLCTEGHITLDLADPAPPRLEKPAGRFARIRRAQSAAAALSPKALLSKPTDPSFAAALDTFIAAIQGDAEPTPGLREGRAALAVAAACRQGPRA